MGRWLGFDTPDTKEGLIEVASVGKDKVLVRPSSITVRSSAGAVTVYKEGPLAKTKLGRGGWTAVGLLLVFLPVVAVLGLLAFSLEQSLEAQRLKNFHFQRQEDPSLQTKLAEAVNDPQTRVVHLQSLEGLPTPGAVTLFHPPLANWLLSFKGLAKLEQGQIYVAWFAKKHLAIPTSDPANYLYLMDFNGSISGSGISEIEFTGIYKGNNSTDYTEMIVTIKSADKQDYKEPTAPIYFSGPPTLKSLLENIGQPSGFGTKFSGLGFSSGIFGNAAGRSGPALTWSNPGFSSYYSGGTRSA